MRQSSPLQIRVTSNGEVIGHLTTEQFRAAQYGAPMRASLSALVAKFNEWKVNIAEPERVELVLRK